MEDMLTEHPELAPDIVKSLSKLLTASRQKVAELEQKVKEQEVSLTTPSSNESYARITENELADLRAAYERERLSGQALRDSLEARFIELRTQETKVDAARQDIASKMEAFSAAAEAITVQAATKARTLQAHLRAAVTEQMESQRALDAARHEISARDEAYATLSNAHETLAEKLRVSQTSLAAASAKTADFAAHTSVAAETLRTLREKLDTANSQMTALHGTHVQLEREVSGLRARQVGLDETISAKQLLLDERDAELHALRKGISAREEEEQLTSDEAADQAREWKKSQSRLAALQAQLEAKEEDNRALRLRDAARETELSALRADISTRAATTRESAALLGLRQENGLLSENLRTAEAAVDSSAAKLKEARLQHDAYAQRAKEVVRDRDEKNKILSEANRQFQHVNRQLQEANKNLHASVLTAGAQAKQELQRAADEERRKLEDEARHRDEEIEHLRYELKVRSRDLKALQNAFQEVEGHRDELLAQVKTSPSASSRSPTPNAYASSSRVEYFEPRRYTPEADSESSDNESGMEDDDEEESSDSDTPDPDSAKQERLSYRQFMKAFPYPQDRPGHGFDRLKPVHLIGNPLEAFTHDLPSARRTLHCPKRSVWCGVERVHVLVFAPTHEYWYSSDSWANRSKMVANCGQQFDFFINQGPYVYYIGTYLVHSLRMAHPPGSKITSDVSPAAILRATGLSTHLKKKVMECFPDGEIRTECFGLQCIGFDQQLYDGLRERFKSACGSEKRKAGPEDIRGKGKAKSQKLS